MVLHHLILIKIHIDFLTFFLEFLKIAMGLFQNAIRGRRSSQTSTNIRDSFKDYLEASLTLPLPIVSKRSPESVLIPAKRTVSSLNQCPSSLQKRNQS